MGRGFREHAGGKASAPGDSAWSIWAEIQRRSSTPFLLPNPPQPPLRASVSPLSLSARSAVQRDCPSCYVMSASSIPLVPAQGGTWAPNRQTLQRC